MNIILSMLTAALYAVFLKNLLFSGGLGASEVIRAAQRNSEILMTSLLVSLFSAAAGGIGVAIRNSVFAKRYYAQGALFQGRFGLFSLPYTWLALIYSLVLLALYLVACGVISLIPFKRRHIAQPPGVNPDYRLLIFSP